MDHRQEAERKRREVVLGMIFTGASSETCVLQLRKIAPTGRCERSKVSVPGVDFICNYNRQHKQKKDEDRGKQTLVTAISLKLALYLLSLKAWAVVCLAKGN